MGFKQVQSLCESTMHAEMAVCREAGASDACPMSFRRRTGEDELRKRKRSATIQVNWGTETRKKKEMTVRITAKVRTEKEEKTRDEQQGKKDKKGESNQSVCRDVVAGEGDHHRETK